MLASDVVASSAMIRIVVANKLSGLRLSESIPSRTRNSATSGKSEGAWPQMPLWRPLRRAPTTAMREHLHDAGIAFVEIESDRLGIAIDAERELSQVVRADREAVESSANASIEMTLFGISHIT